MRDLQTEWEPTAFIRVLCLRPGPTHPMHEICFCQGPQTDEEQRLGLCMCKFAEQFGVYDIRPTLPPVRGCGSCSKGC